MSNFIAPDLTARPPRSPRVSLGGYVQLSRILDKCRATIAGTSGEFRFGSQSMDRHFLHFTSIDADTLKPEVATGKSDSEMLAWVQENSKIPREPWEIVQWSEYMLRRGSDSDIETLQLGRADIEIRGSSRSNVDALNGADLVKVTIKPEPAGRRHDH